MGGYNTPDTMVEIGAQKVGHEISIRTLHGERDVMLSRRRDVVTCRALVHTSAVSRHVDQIEAFTDRRSYAVRPKKPVNTTEITAASKEYGFYSCYLFRIARAFNICY